MKATVLNKCSRESWYSVGHTQGLTVLYLKSTYGGGERLPFSSIIPENLKSLFTHILVIYIYLNITHVYMYIYMYVIYVKLEYFT